jgi:hypothetical protein
MARTQLFLLSVGIREDRLRFRQHLKTEMAHYATGQTALQIDASVSILLSAIAVAVLLLHQIDLILFFCLTIICYINRLLGC